jgi:hypothetical protein
MTEFDMSRFEAVSPEEAKAALAAPELVGGLTVRGQDDRPTEMLGVTVTPVPGTEKAKSPFAKEQKDDAARAVRMLDAAKVMADLEDSGFNFANAYDSLLIEYAPFIPDVLENYFHSTKYQLYQRAMEDFLQAQLRAETGAAITQQEFPMVFRRYVPMPGDTPEAIAAKREARFRDAQVTKANAGAAYEQSKQDVRPEQRGNYTRTQEQALEELKERAKTDPELKARLEMRGVTFDE